MLLHVFVCSLEHVAATQAQDVLAIPAQSTASGEFTYADWLGNSEDSGQFTYADWLDNSNPKWHPPSYREFYFYNVTNTGLFLLPYFWWRIDTRITIPVPYT